jgi:gliding motility-associated-like protein
LCNDEFNLYIGKEYPYALMTKMIRLLLSFLFILIIPVFCFSQANLWQGLVAYYPFTGNTIDATTLNQQEINALRPSQLCSDWLRTTNQLDGVRIGDLDIAGNQLTVEAIFNRVAPYSSGYLYAGNIVSKHKEPTDCNYLLRPRHAEISTSNGFFSTPQVCDFQLNKTYHVAMVYDGSFLKFYRNGYLMSQVAATGNLIQNNWITTIGENAYATGPYTIAEHMNGFINEVRIWNRARTQAEIQGYMNTSLSAPTTQPGLQAYYVFNDLLNKQGNAAWNGTLQGGAAINQSNVNCTQVIDSCELVVTSVNAIASFTIPDTVCINNPVNITNTSTGASSYFWNFCVADIDKAPVATNIGNPGGVLQAPVFMDYAFVNGNYYGFTTNFTPGGLVRLDFGNSLLNTPAAVNLGNFGGIIPPNNSAEGLQVVENEGKWYVIMVGGNPAVPGGVTPRVLKIELGTNIANPAPVATDWGNLGNMLQPIDLHLFKDGINWYGFTVNSENNTITRFNFTNSFNNTPTAINLGNIGGLSYPTGIYAINDNGNYRVFITNGGDNSRNTHANWSLSRLDFGNSLLNTPTGVNLGNPGGVLRHSRDLTIMRSCDQIIAFAVNGAFGSDDIVKLNFNNDLSSVPTGTSLGNIGNLNFPHSISKLFRVNEDIYGFVTNVVNSTITRFRFEGCANASVASSSAQTPPPVTYNTPGTYNINLTVDDGLPTQSAFCKQVVVMAAPVQAPTQQVRLCSGNNIRIGTGTKYAKYTWNTGAHTDSIDVTAGGKYWVEIDRFGCIVADTVVVTASNCTVIASFTAPDTICINNPVTLTNTSIGASSYFWNFCVADITTTPQGTNLGNISNNLSMPVFMDYVYVNGNYYGFSVNHAPGGLVRLDFGNSLLNTPTSVNLGNFGGNIPVQWGAEGIRVVQNNGKWYAIVVGGATSAGYTPRILKFDFGTNITNPTPAVTNWGNLGNMEQPIDFDLFQEGGNWYGFAVNALNNTFTRFNFTNSFDNTPTAVNLGNIGGLSYPTGIYTVNDNGNFRVFIVNSGSTVSLTRLDFGSSLLNTPTGVNLGNPGNILSTPRDITVMRSCGQFVAFVVNGRPGFGEIVRLNFNDNPTSIPTPASLGNVGSLDFAHSISRLFRVNEDIFGFVTNAGNNTLTRFRFPGCTNASIANSSAETPPPITYNTPGTYNINLTIDDGLPTQTAYCRQVVVLAAPVSAPTQRIAMCSGVTQRIGTATRSATYLWNTGATTDSIDVSAPGTYWVDIDRFGCKATDTFVIRAAACSNISNIINDYTEVLALDPCKNSLVVGDATAYNVGDTVLLIQMKGAVMDVTNTAAFGNVLNYQSAGNYEFNYVKSKTGNTIELLNTITKSFDVPNGKVQLVRVPYYEDAVITSTLTCLPWDGGKGGIVVLNARNTINLNANIDVSQKGFRGGAAEIKPSDCAETNYFYDQTSNKAALKGEGIVLVNSNMIRGRGKAVNGGGGGNNHNAGGGGGSNAGAGGVGGRETFVAGCAQLNNGGVGGAPLPYTNAQNKIFMGGGGGAGDVNGVTGVAAPGGNGGGIVIVVAPVLYTNSNAILSTGQTPANCSGGDCWEGQSGGGAGGTVLLSVDNVVGNTTINTSGGNGASFTNPNTAVGYNGTGGGGGGGMLWTKTASLPAGITHTTAGGVRGVFIATGNDGGAQNGGLGQTAFSLQLPVASAPFKANIDSVKIRANIVACTPPSFEGLAWTNTRPISSWLWSFGDGATATTQNATHIYQAPGNYTVKLVVTDANGCQDSISMPFRFDGVLDFDFAYQIDVCSPLDVQFTGLGSTTTNAYWEFGDNTTATGATQVSHTYAAEGTYKVRYSVTDGTCTDTITKFIPINILRENIVLTADTTICAGTTKQLRAVQALSYCWFPTTYLDNPAAQNPVTSTPQDITYYLHSESTGNNLIVNGDFSAGNTGFTSQYVFAANNTTEGEYFVGPNPQLWNASTNSCADHTGNGNMMLVNGNPIADQTVWTQTINVVPNTNYAFSTWIQSIYNVNPAQLQFSINGKDLGSAITASVPSCNWQQFYTTWNSGNSTTALISIVNKNTIIMGNDFALDDISFAQVIVKRDSVVIKVDSPVVRANNDTTVCFNKPVPLIATGAATYAWSPTVGLSNPAISNPIATPVASGVTTYIVTGTTVNGCAAKDTVLVNVFPKLDFDFGYKIDVCSPLAVQFTGLGSTTSNPYWDLGDNTTATGVTQISHVYASENTYSVRYSVTDGTCTDTLTKLIAISTLKDNIVLTPDTVICAGTTKQLRAVKALSYCWFPTTYLDNPAAQNPITNTPQDITYYLNTEVTGNNLIANGDFSAGNTGFGSDYTFTTANSTVVGVYAINSNPSAWNSWAAPCADHTSGNGNMIMFDGANIPGQKVWHTTVSITPNTNFAFSSWIQSIHSTNPAKLQFFINGKLLGNIFSASATTCQWQQFYEVWNSGNATTAEIAIVNQNTNPLGNDFALDDISFAPVIVKRDSVVIKVDRPIVRTNNDTTVCSDKQVPLFATGAATYTWSPAAGLSNPAIGNPVAIPAATPTQYIVTGTTTNGCVAKDTVVVGAFAKPTITKTSDTLVCRNSSFPLFIAGGVSYAWSSAGQLSGANSDRPIVSVGMSPVTYQVEITDSHSCVSLDSVEVAVRPYPVFRATGNLAICAGSSQVMQASGGDTYEWSPARWFDNPAAPSPVVTPEATTLFSVYIRENTCGFDTTINMLLTVNPIPVLTVDKANDVNCNTPTAQLNVTGAMRYTWSPATGLDNPSKANPVAAIDTTTEYRVTGINQFGCSSNAYIQVKATKDGIPRFVVPNAFTPNGDRKNDCFGIQRWGNAIVQEFTVYNRWGQKVFQSNNPNQCWDGTFNGKPQDSGGYVYVIRAKTLCGEVTTRGIVMLVR